MKSIYIIIAIIGWTSYASFSQQLSDVDEYVILEKGQQQRWQLNSYLFGWEGFAYNQGTMVGFYNSHPIQGVEGGTYVLASKWINVDQIPANTIFSFEVKQGTCLVCDDLRTVGKVSVLVIDSQMDDVEGCEGSVWLRRNLLDSYRWAETVLESDILEEEFQVSWINLTLNKSYSNEQAINDPAGTYNIQAFTNPDNYTLNGTKVTGSLTILQRPGISLKQTETNLCLDEESLDLEEFILQQEGNLSIEVWASVMENGSETAVKIATGSTLQVNDIPENLAKDYLVVTYNSTQVGCTAEQKFLTIHLKESPLVSLNLPDNICIANGKLALEAAPTGGTWSGEGVSGNMLDPSIAGEGAHTITYTFTNGNNCTAQQSHIINIFPEVNFTFDLPPSFCKENGKTIDLYSYTTGVQNGIGEFQINGSVVAGGNWELDKYPSDTYQVVYKVENGACTKEVTEEVSLLSQPQVNAGADIEFCGQGQITLTGASPQGGTWKANSNQITVNQNIVLTGEIDFEGNLEKTFELTYTYENANGCKGSDVRTLTIFDQPEVPEVNYTQICSSGQTTITIENYDSKFTYDWYENNQKIIGANGGKYTTGLLTQNTNYQIIASNPLNNTCQEIKTVEVEITPKPEKPSVDDVVICQPERVTLKASHSGAVTHFNWYDQSGNLLNDATGLDDTFTTSTSMTKDAVFYVSAVINGCEGEQEEVKVMKLSPPNQPEIKGGTHCGPGKIRLEITSNDGDFYRWYKSETSTEIIHEGKTYTPFLNQTTVYFVAAVNRRDIPGIGTFDCEGERMKITGTVYGIPAQPEEINYTTCGIEFVELEGKGGIGENYTWYNTSNIKVGEGRYFKAGQVSKNEIFYYSTTTAEGCESEQAKVNITYNATPPLPQVSDMEKCGVGNITVTPKGEEGAIFRFYSVNDRDNYLYEGATYTPYIQGQARFFVSQVVEGCEGQQQGMEVTYHPVPNVPFVEDVAYCGTSSISISASGGSVGSQYKWYESLEAETPLFIGSRFSQNELAQTTSYYVSVTSKQNCESERVKVTAFIHEIPEVPLINEGYICGGAGQTTLSIQNPMADLTYEWYAASGQLLHTGPTFPTPYLTTTTSYKVKAISKENCESDLGSGKAIIISDEPVAIGEDISLCKWGEPYLLSDDINPNLKGGIFTGKGVINDSLFLPEGLEEGIYEIQYTYNKGGCKAFGSRKIEITNGIGTAELTLENELIQVCENADPISLDEYVYSGYVAKSTWAGDGVTSNVFDPNVLAPGVYHLDYQVEINGCVYMAKQAVEVIKSFAVKPRLSESVIEVCENDLVSIFAGFSENNKDYHWYNDNNELIGKGTTLDFQATKSDIISCKGVDAKGCESDPATIVLNTYEFPDSIIASTQKIKIRESVEFDVFDPNEGENTYDWDFGDNQQSSLKSPAIFYYKPGEYQVKLVVANLKKGCSDTLTYQISVNGIPDTSDVITGLDDEFINNSIKIFPNPFSEVLKVEIDTKESSNIYLKKSAIQVFDLLGKQPLKPEDFSGNGNTIWINTESLPNGIYIIKIKSRTFKLTKS
ncbi:PKD domain-containing protein [Flexithrix dorotheae]|uniref:Ig-like domain-containing protein n=1 Tax=Flexithrix dorotheae TaxID=70993 RepID=UPI00035DCEBA|nr:T9SS type A sorting domain-containing protein [Flexithrix dorotheae]